MTEEKTETAEISPTYETSLASIKAAELTKKKEVRRLYGWLIGRVLREEGKKEFHPEPRVKISLSSLGRGVLREFPKISHLDHAVYISRNRGPSYGQENVLHYAFLVCPDGKILRTGYVGPSYEISRKKDLSTLKPADIRAIEELRNCIRDEILPEALGNSKK